MTDVEEAVKAIVEQAEKGNPGRDVYLTSDIHEAVVAKLRAKFTRRFILIRTIEESGLRHAPRPSAARIDEPDRADITERAQP
jgi:hypothetical protein